MSDEPKVMHAMHIRSSHGNRATVVTRNSGDLLIINAQSTFWVLGQGP